MNERIRELAEQAGFIDIGSNHTAYMSFDHEKFAELIISECAALAKSKSEYIQSMKTDDRGDQMQIQSLAWQFEEFGYKIKKHFGVTE
jgi:alpha-D-ribose 1-methylphosphonate 5-phosphate C-P lyase